MPMQVPTPEEYRGHLEAVRLYEAIKSDVLHQAILDGEVRAVSKPEQALNALQEYIDNTVQLRERVSAVKVQNEVPITGHLHGKTIAAHIARHPDYQCIGKNTNGRVFQRMRFLENGGGK